MWTADICPDERGAGAATRHALSGAIHVTIPCNAADNLPNAIWPSGLFPSAATNGQMG